ncbi:ATP phosphoribosyltransferase regulatory subunit [Agrilactobacillus yilanensis]|uniref:ATP phosphoribosyltransferase regulatory subunit n=1 Tax=Agrilactobacillus yilanensis TaxID=2485997 RepID=A0ABW4JAW2_9LACO|nr:ATP phosphoribosyltransferase regulatory subunit [Agrilactobacillus yilanensis]
MSNKQLPTGTRDEFGTIAMVKEQVTQTIQTNLKNRGFQKIITPLLEYRDVFKPLAKQTYQPYQLIDEHGDTLVLRPDMTLPVARVMSATGIDTPVKWYYSGDIFRVKRRLSGSYNQVTQAGLEIIGYASLKAEWECLITASEICQQLAIPDLTIELSDAQFVAKVLNVLPINDLMQQNLKTALFAKDLTHYAKLIQPLKNDRFYPFLEAWPWLFGDFEAVLQQLTTLPQQPALQNIIGDLKKTKNFLQQHFPTLTVTLDLSVESPQEYYTGMVFKAYSQAANDYLFSGGRYDQLLSNFQQTIQPAVGLAFDIDAIVAQQALQQPPVKTLIYFEPEQWADAQALQANIPNSSLCLTDSSKAAQRIAEQQAAKLIDLTERQA